MIVDPSIEVTSNPRPIWASRSSWLWVPWVRWLNKESQIMAKANPVDLLPQAPVPPKVGPEIIYFGEGAKDVKFTVNPKAVKYVVKGGGQVAEYL